MRERIVRAIGEVTIDGASVTQRQRALLAALALHRATGATMDALVDAMWCDRAPTSARKSVQNQVARLRHVFGPDLIVTDGDRYHLNARTDVAVIDQAAAHFEPLSATAGDIHEVASVLATWHGTPFVDLADSPQADAERARLELLQARLVESLTLARLTGHRGTDARADAIIQLTVRTSTHPLHERAWELLVAALHMDGRRTEALGAYARFGEVLDRQLGVTPSRDFQRLRAIVDADQLLDPVAAFGGTTYRPVPTLLASA